MEHGKPHAQFDVGRWRDGRAWIGADDGKSKIYYEGLNNAVSISERSAVWHEYFINDDDDDDSKGVPISRPKYSMLSTTE